jgi:hypothetical protein
MQAFSRLTEAAKEIATCYVRRDRRLAIEPAPVTRHRVSFGRARSCLGGPAWMGVDSRSDEPASGKES